MIKGAIFALALVAGLVALANAQQKDVGYFRESVNGIHKRMGKDAPGFAIGLATAFQSSCLSADARSFAKDLENESTGNYRCAVAKLGRPAVLIKVFRRLPNQEKSTIKFLDRIRFQSRSEDVSTIEKLVAQGKELCEQYVGDVSPFLDEASQTDYANSKIFARMSFATNACRLYLKLGITQEAMVALGRHANELYDQMKSDMKLAKEGAKVEALMAAEWNAERTDFRDFY